MVPPPVKSVLTGSITYRSLHGNQLPGKLLFELRVGLCCLTPLPTLCQLYRGGKLLLVEETGVRGETHRSAAGH